MNSSLISKTGGLLLLFFTLLFTTTTSFAQVDELGASNSRFYYSGLLGSSEIEFNMQVTGYEVSGSYMTVNSGQIFLFKGRLAADKTGMGVLVYDEENNYIASVEAKVISQELDFGREIKGVWKSISGSNNRRLALNKVAEFAKKEPKEASRQINLID